jgi:hypothetical protein
MACLATVFLFFKNGKGLLIPEHILYELAKEVVLSEEEQKKRILSKIKKIFKAYTGTVQELMAT